MKERINVSRIPEILDQLNLVWNEIEGTIERISPVENCEKGDLIFVDRDQFAKSALKREFTCVVTTQEIYDNHFRKSGVSSLITESVSLAHAIIRTELDDRNPADEDWSGVHPSAIIHETAKLAPTCTIGPGVVIGKDVVIGENSVILARTVIEHGVRIGDHTWIHPGVVIGYNSIIGNGVIIKSGAILGSEGFGFAQDKNRKSYRIPQTGIVRIGDDVVIGAGCCIDRATYGETSIGNGTKMDNLCHIAHNVKIGKDCLLTAGFIVAGSTTIGDRMIASGQTGILDHLRITDDVVLLHRAGVTDHIEKPGAYAGLPLQPLTEYLRNTVIIKKLTGLRKQLRELRSMISSEDPGE